MAEGHGGSERGAVRVPTRLPWLRPEPEDHASGAQLAADREVPWAGGGIFAHTRRATEILTYLSGAVGIILLWSLWRQHLVSQRPLWLLLVVLAAAGGVGWVGDTFHRAERSTR